MAALRSSRSPTFVKDALRLRLSAAVCSAVSTAPSNHSAVYSFLVRGRLNELELTRVGNPLTGDGLLGSILGQPAQEVCAGVNTATASSVAGSSTASGAATNAPLISVGLPTGEASPTSSTSSTSSTAAAGLLGGIL